MSDNIQREPHTQRLIGLKILAPSIPEVWEYLKPEDRSAPAVQGNRNDILIKKKSFASSFQEIINKSEKYI